MKTPALRAIALRPGTQHRRPDKLVLAACGSIAVALAATGLKLLAYWQTGSAALYSDALESVVNLATAAMALYAVRGAQQPADRRHQFGHHKAEYFSAVVEGVLIAVAALLILQEAWDAFVRPRTLGGLTSGMALNALATAANGAWGAFLIVWGGRQRSPATSLIVETRQRRPTKVANLFVWRGLSARNSSRSRLTLPLALQRMRRTSISR